MPQTECNWIKNTTTGLYIIAVNGDGTYSWGNLANAVCFNEQMHTSTLSELGEGFVGPNPKNPR